VFERYPRLCVSFGESGDLMKLKPSGYWHRQCKATFRFDPINAKLIGGIGVEMMMRARTTRTPRASG